MVRTHRAIWLIPVLALVALTVRCTPGEADATAAQGPVLLVCLDGATFDLVTPLAAEGRLPVLRGLMDRGVSAPLATIEPTVSPAIWTTVATGRPPEDHGILGFDGVPGQSMATLPTTDMRHVRAFWNILSEHDRSVGVAGWWVTWPVEPVNGWMVSDRTAYTRMEATIGREALRRCEVYPEEIAVEVRSRVRGPGALDAEDVRAFMSLTDEEARELVLSATYRHGDLFPEFKYVHQSDRSITDIAVHLMQTRSAGVTAVGLYGVDVMSHLAWHYMEPEKFPQIELTDEGRRKFGEIIRNYYAYLDGLVGELVAASGPDTTVIVFSDHGFGATGHLPWTGGHGRLTPGAPIAPPGILIMAGPTVDGGAHLDAPHVLDLAPTLLALQGLPPSREMPGRVLTEALTGAALAGLPDGRVASYETGPPDRLDCPRGDEELDEELLDKLRALGYIDR